MFFFKRDGQIGVSTEGSDKDGQGTWHLLFEEQDQSGEATCCSLSYLYVCFLMKEIHDLPLGNFSTQNQDKKVTIKKFDVNAYKENISIGLNCPRMKKCFERMTLSEWTLSLWKLGSWLTTQLDGSKICAFT